MAHRVHRGRGRAVRARGRGRPGRFRLSAGRGGLVGSPLPGSPGSCRRQERRSNRATRLSVRPEGGFSSNSAASTHSSGTSSTTRGSAPTSHRDRSCRSTDSSVRIDSGWRSIRRLQHSSVQACAAWPTGASSRSERGCWPSARCCPQPLTAKLLSSAWVPDCDPPHPQCHAPESATRRPSGVARGPSTYPSVKGLPRDGACVRGNPWSIGGLRRQNVDRATSVA